MFVQSTAPDLAPLHRLCIAANRIVFADLGYRNSCILTSAALCDALHALGHEAELMRVTAGVFGHERYATVLGSDGDGSRRPRAAPGKWHGHLCVIADRRYLLDPTLDQAPGAHPFTGEITDAWLAGGVTLWWTDAGRSTTFPAGGIPTIRYRAFPGRGGWKSAPDFRPSRRRAYVAAIVAQA